jgi:DNA-binding transcriptional LysR family regulator
MVAGGIGVALVPRLASCTVPAGAVVRPLAPPAPARHLFAATRTGADQHPAVKPVLAGLVEIARRTGGNEAADDATVPLT